MSLRRSAPLLALIFTPLVWKTNCFAEALSVRYVEEHLVEVDRNKDDRLSFEEFVDMNRGELKNDFQGLDRNHDGKLTREELRPRRRQASTRPSGDARFSGEDRWELKRSIREARVGSDND